ncbi:hypothetical protein HDU76_008972, partial [Blyttiomyces sp. JEL0837]
MATTSIKRLIAYAASLVTDFNGLVIKSEEKNEAATEQSIIQLVQKIGSVAGYLNGLLNTPGMSVLDKADFAVLQGMEKLVISTLNLLMLHAQRCGNKENAYVGKMDTDDWDQHQNLRDSVSCLPDGGISIDWPVINQYICLGYTWRDIAYYTEIEYTLLQQQHQSPESTPHMRYSGASKFGRLYEVVTYLKSENKPISEFEVRSQEFNIVGSGPRFRKITTSLQLDASIELFLRNPQQRIYSLYPVKYSNQVWHMDSICGLHEWGIMIHSALDGKSKLCMYLQASINNHAATVKDHFLKATATYGWPQTVEASQCLENIEVAALMEASVRAGSSIFGVSVNTIALEEFAKDINKEVLKHFSEVFLHLEHVYDFKKDEEWQLWVLHFVYIPILNQQLTCNSIARNYDKSHLDIWQKCIKRQQAMEKSNPVGRSSKHYGTINWQNNDTVTDIGYMRAPISPASIKILENRLKRMQCSFPDDDAVSYFVAARKWTWELMD